MYPIQFKIRKGRGNSGRLEEVINDRNYFLNPQAIKYDALKKEMKGLQNKLNSAPIYTGGVRRKPVKIIGSLGRDIVAEVKREVKREVAQVKKRGGARPGAGRPKGSKNKPKK